MPSLSHSPLIVLALHTVHKDVSAVADIMHPQQEFSTGDLQWVIEKLNTMGVEFAHPNELSANSPLGSSPRVLVTFDDGYYNNLEAFEILKKYRIPSLLFPVPWNVETGESFWWDAVARKGRRGGRSWQQINSWIERLKREPAARLRHCLMEAGMSPMDFIPAGDNDRPLSRAELKEVLRGGLVVLGNHTYSHEILTRCTNAERHATISKAQEYLTDIAGCNTEWIAYPNGSYDSGVIRTVRSLGLRYGATLLHEPNLASSGQELELGRFLVWGNKDLSAQIGAMFGVGLRDRVARQLKQRLRTIRVRSKDFIAAATGQVPWANKFQPRLYCVCPSGGALNGQRRATDMMVAALASGGWDCIKVGTPSLDRTKSLVNEFARMMRALLGKWWFMCSEIRNAPGICHINLGQSTAAFLRDGLFLFACSRIAQDRAALVSLHGSWFMSWPKESFRAKWLARIVNASFLTTVLGEDQRLKLEELGVPLFKTRVLDNCSEIPPLDEEAVRRKHLDGQGPIRILFLSLLVDTKGYPEFLDCLGEYGSRRDVPPIEAILCGDIVTAGHSVLYSNDCEAREYIEGMVRKINHSPNVSLRWVRGAEGGEKTTLFRDAQIFVLPSKIEGQPLVLLEAMSSGCAIIATDVGQIRQTVGASGIIISDNRPPTILAALEALVRDAGKRADMGLAGVRSVQRRFTTARYAMNWLGIMAEITEARKREAEGRLRRVWFVFADARSKFSGQMEATKIIFDNLPGEAWSRRLVRLPTYERDRSRFLQLPRYCGALLRAQCSYIRLLWEPRAVIHLSLGQTTWALVREGLPYCVVNLLLRRKGVVALNGDNFMRWRSHSLNAVMLRAIARSSHAITVVGERQRERAIDLGISPAAIQVHPNTCACEAISEGYVYEKHADPSCISVLYLSSLIDSKGYPEFVDAIRQLAAQGGVGVRARLCGTITLNPYSERFKTHGGALRWVEEQIKNINSLGEDVRLEWIRGARGVAKWSLFREAQVFVLPTRYAVEAQPIALLEAMAHGCAIITSRVGEIPSMLDESCAIFVDPRDVDAIAAAIRGLAADRNRRYQLGLQARRRFSSQFGRAEYVRRWDDLLTDAFSAQS